MVKNKNSVIACSLVFLSFFYSAYPTSAVSSSDLQDAIIKLDDSLGSLSMSLSLELITPNLLNDTLLPSSLSIFAPPDKAFVDQGQPSFDLLRYHISPVKFSPQNLSSLPIGTEIPTLFTSHALIVTPSKSGQISINSVNLNASVICGHGQLAVYGMTENFFDPSFKLSSSSPRSTTPAVVALVLLLLLLFLSCLLINTYNII